VSLRKVSLSLCTLTRNEEEIILRKTPFYGTLLSLAIALPPLLTSKISLADEWREEPEVDKPPEGIKVFDEVEKKREESRQKHPQRCKRRDKTDETDAFVFDCDEYKGWKIDGGLLAGVMFYRYEDNLMGTVKGKTFVGGFGGHVFLSEKLLPEKLSGTLGAHIISNISLEGYVQTSAPLKTNNSNTVLQFAQDDSSYPITTVQDQKSERFDYSINFGYQFEPFRSKSHHWFEPSVMRVFLGYRGGDTTVHGKALIFPGSTIVPTDPVEVTTVPLETQAHLKSGGLFLGYRFMYPFSWGDMGMTLAVTKLNVDYSYTNTYMTSVLKIPDLSTDAECIGSSLGFDWEMPIIPVRDKLSIKLHASANFHIYQMDVLKTVFPNGSSFGGFPVTESTYTLKLGLIAQF